MKWSIAYDKDHDILHIRYAPIVKTEDTYIKPGIILKRETKHGRLNSAVVMDFSKREPQLISKYIKEIDFSALKKQYAL